ncbi:hypothetical protein G7046_g4762 [Stylonectria norvegica]|nr:hypothetical protein G7046_g4762 [Stylonectria norvegica]
MIPATNGAPATRVAWSPTTRVLPRATNSCHPQPEMNLCEKSAVSSRTTYIVLVALSVVLVTAVLALLVILHLRRRRLDKLEKTKDLQELEDYGLARHHSPPGTHPSPLPSLPPPIHIQFHDPHIDYEEDRLQPPTSRFSDESLGGSIQQRKPTMPHDALFSR